MMELKYSELLKLNKELGNNLKSNPIKISVLSNIIVHQSKELLEYFLRIECINAIVKYGDYDNLAQDSEKYQDSNVVIIFWELCNVIDGFHYNIELNNKEQINRILENTKAKIDLVLKNLKETSLILFNKFSSLHFWNSNIKSNNLEELVDQLNHYLEQITPINVKLVDLDKVIASIGLDNSIDLRYYYSSKALYTVDFFKRYSYHVKPYIMSVCGKSKKALIFDCDNTLWKGILGEDGFENIEMSPKTKEGAIYSEIQSLALALNNQGTLIGLCSKNNPDDVDKVIESHPDMQLKNKHITINKSNWSDKVTNLKEIAQELNIGLDSIVFVDDSSFEVNLIKKHLPEVKVLQVPEKLYEYPKMLRENHDLFYDLSFTAEDKNKIKMYRQQIKRLNIKKEFIDIDDYLASLHLKITIYKNDKNIVPRMSQMSQKTNQFNLTTKRYSERDIKNFFDDSNTILYAFSVADKFGDSGITGLCIVTKDNKTKTANIDTFLMSCRVIGRKIEYTFMDYLIDNLKNMNIRTLKAKYIKTKKNEQVKEFYDDCLFDQINENELIKKYSLKIENYKSKDLNYIEVINE